MLAVLLTSYPHKLQNLTGGCTLSEQRARPKRRTRVIAHRPRKFYTSVIRSPISFPLILLTYNTNTMHNDWTGKKNAKLNS